MLRRGVPTAVALALLALAPSARAAITVDPAGPDNCTPGGTCRTIAAAFGAAANPDTITVRPGIYTDPASTNKSLTVNAAPGAALSVATGPALSFTGGTSSVDGLVVASQSGEAVRASATVMLTTVTVSRSIVLASAGAPFAVSGGISTASLTVSFVTGAGATTSPVTGPPPTSTFAATNSILPAPPAEGNNIATDPALFVDAAGGNYHLRRTAAAAIDKATGTAPPTDIDGQARFGAADIGADEAVPVAPTTPAISASPATTSVNQAVTFTASGASDPDAFASRGIASYRWVFGDGTTQETSGASTTHAYAGPGTFGATVTAVDGDGNASATSAPVAVTVNAAGSGGGGGNTPGGDPTTIGPPIAKITSPRSGQTLKRTRVVTKTKRVKRRGKVVKRKVKVRTTKDVFIRGTAQDANGVRSVRVALVRGSATGQRCQFFDSRSFSQRLCAVPFYLFARISDTKWSLKISKKAKLPAGRYTVFVSAIDFKSNPSIPSPATGSSLEFRVR